MSSNHERYGSLHSRFLDTVGDGTGSIDQNVNGSVTPVDFKILCPPGVTYEINQASVLIRDTGTLDTDKYGNGIALTNGFSIVTSRPTRAPVEINYTVQHPILTNGSWAAYTSDIKHFTFGSGSQILSITYHFRQEGRPIKLGEGEAFIFRVNDNLAGLNEHHVRAGMTVYPAVYVP